MSAWLVSNTDVNALATVAAEHGIISDPPDAALMLWLENRTSLRSRYADADHKWPGLDTLEERFSYAPAEPAPGLHQVLLTYFHQASQHPHWRGGRAEALCFAIIAATADS